MKSEKLFKKLIANRNSRKVEEEIFSMIIGDPQYVDKYALKIFLIYIYRTFINILCTDDEYILLFLYERRYSFYKLIEFWKIYLGYYKKYLYGHKIEIINEDLLYSGNIIDEKVFKRLSLIATDSSKLEIYFEKLKKIIAFLNKYDFPAKILIMNYIRSLSEYSLFDENKQLILDSLIRKSIVLKDSFLIYGSPDFQQTDVEKKRIKKEVIKEEEIKKSNELSFKKLQLKTHKLLGRGGSARVYLISVDRSSNMTGIPTHFKMAIDRGDFFAYKIVHVDMEDDYFTDVKNEITILNKLRGNEVVVQMYDYVIETRSIGIIMEAGEEDLENYLQRKKKEFFQTNLNTDSTIKLESECAAICDYYYPYTKNCFDSSNFGFLTIEEIEILFSRLLEIFKVLSENHFVHRDIKHKNFIFIDGKLKIIDFGLSRAISEERSKHHTKKNAGTVAFMAPEAFSNEVSRKTDIWALGMLFHEIIFGRLIFKNYHQSELINLQNTKLEIEIGCTNGLCKCRKLIKRTVKYYCAEHRTMTPLSQYEKYIRMIREAIKLNPAERASIETLYDMFNS